MNKIHTANVKLNNFTNMFLRKAEIITFEPFTVETDGCTFVAVKGCLGIELYTEEKVVLSCENIIASVCGHDLCISVFSFEDTYVTGIVSGIEFVNKGK